MRKLRLAMAQINPTVGDIKGNCEKILSHAEEAKKRGAGLVLFPELALTGYPPEDLLLKPGFIDDNLSALSALSKKIRGITAVVGFVDRKADIYNAAAIIHNGRTAGVYHKMYLPNYGVFDEQRDFQAGAAPRGRRGHRKHKRLSLPYRQGRDKGGDAHHKGQGQRGHSRLQQHRGRTGRAGLRSEERRVGKECR